MQMDHEQLAREFLRSLRGSRSQVAWSRRLGYKSNVAHSWEKGRRWPTAAEAFRAAERNGVDLQHALQVFFGGGCPPWVSELELCSPEAVGRLLDELRGSTSVMELSRRTGISRYAIARWISAQTEPKLPDFFLLFESASTRLIDLVSVLGDPSTIPTVAEQVRIADLRRQGAFRLPWTQGVLRAIELAGYRQLAAHEPGWIGRMLGIDMETEARCLSFLLDTGQVSWDGTHYQGRTIAVDTRGRPEIGRRLKSHWSQEAVRRIEDDAPGQFSYVVFSASRKDFERIRELHLRYFNTLRGLISESSPNELVGVANVQLFELTDWNDEH